MPRSAPQPAQCEDYDSDASAVTPGTRREARRSTKKSGPPRTLERYKTGKRDGGSDSGYSSHSGSLPGSSAPVNSPSKAQAEVAARPSTAQTTAKTKPDVHRSDSHRNKGSPPTPTSTQPTGYPSTGDPRYPSHSSTTADPRRYSMSQQQPPQYNPRYSAQYAQTPAYPYHYPQASQMNAAQAVGYPPTQPRKRSDSTAQPRPASIHFPSYSGLYNGGQQGPPPANPANQYAQYPAYYQQQAYQPSAYGTAPAVQHPQYYAQASPVKTSPTSSNFATPPNPQLTYSTRPVQNAVIGKPGTQTHQRTASRTATQAPYSARTVTMPGSFPAESDSAIESESETESETDSEASSYDYEEQREQELRDHANKSKLITAQAPRRPSIAGRQHATAPVVPTTRSRDKLQRNPRSEGILHDISSSDNVDSDRTARADVGRRPSHRQQQYLDDAPKPSRRTSTSTSTHSSNHSNKHTTHATRAIAPAPPSRTHSAREPRDHTSTYHPPDRPTSQLRHRQASIEAYQQAVASTAPARAPKLTAESIRRQTASQQHPDAPKTSPHSASASSAHKRPQLTQHAHHRRGSHAGAASQASSSRRSGSHTHTHTHTQATTPQQQGEGVMIESSGMVMHVYGDTRVEMRPGEDGVGAQFTIGGGAGGGSGGGSVGAERRSASERDSAYHSSRSSYSQGAGRGARRAEAVMPEESEGSGGEWEGRRRRRR